jgi:choline dehydrogenase-like flavoprotein
MPKVIPINRIHGGLLVSLARAAIPEEGLRAVPPEKILENLQGYLGRRRSPLTEKLRRVLSILADLPVKIDGEFLKRELSQGGPLRPLLITALQIIYVGFYGDSGSYPLIGYIPFEQLHPERLPAPSPPAEKLPIRQPERTISTDVCIIGSGAAGAVLAHGLADQGREVLILERGPYIPPEEFTNREIEMLGRLYAQAGLQYSLDFAMHIVQGSCVGGSTTVNNGICLRLDQAPEGAEILDDWRGGGADLETARLFASYDRVAAMIQPTEVPEHRMNPGAKLLEEGFKAWSEKTEAQLLSGRFLLNFKDCLGSGYCNIGCKYGRKLSMLVSYLPRAARTGRVQVLPDCEARSINTDRKRATQVVCRSLANANPKTIRVTADTFVVSSGAIASSALLRNSQIMNHHIGDRVGFNAGSLVHAVFDKTRFPEGLNSFDGVQMCNYVRGEQAEFYIESIFNPPLAHALSVPGWLNDHYDHMKQYPYFSTAGVIVRTQPVGRLVWNLLLGSYVVDFRIDHGRGDDWQKLIRGIKLAAEIWLSAGAKKVLPATAHLMEIHNRQELAKFDGIRAKDLFHGSSHPQGGNAMSDRPGEGVVNSRFQVKDLIRGAISNLYVCDASVFPTSIGINPQWTVMAMADYAVETGRIT